MYACQAYLSKVAGHIVVTDLKTQIGIGITMILATGCGGVHISEQDTIHVVLTGKDVVVVEMTVPSDGLAIGRVRHVHTTSHDFVVLLGKCCNLILGVVVTPCRDEHSVLIIIRNVVLCSIVDREQGLEGQALNEFVHVVVDTGIELELTAHAFCLTTEIAVGKNIRISCLGSTGEIDTVEQVERLAKDGMCLGGIGVNHFDGNQRGCVFREVRTAVVIAVLTTGCNAPIVTLIAVCIIEGSTHIGITRDLLVDDQVHITTYAEAVGVVILCRTEVDEVLEAIVVDVRVEVSTCTTTLDFYSTFRTVVHLAYILV